MQARPQGRAAFGSGMITFAVVLLVIGGLVWLEVGRQRKALDQLGALAARLGLELKVVKRPFGLQQHSVEGIHQGKSVRFWSYTTGSGKSQRRWIAVGVQPRKCGTFSFRIEPQGMGTRVAEFFGAKEIQVGDRRFDDAWFVRTNAPDIFGAALVPEVRAKLMSAREAGAKGSFRLEQGWVMYAEEGSFAKTEAAARLEGLLPALLDLADLAEVCAGQG
jgi:hypothetical protein